MLVIRMAQSDDIDAISRLAETSGGSLTNLPDDKDILSKKLNRVQQALALTIHQQALFWFVLEDTHTGQLVGVSGIEAAIGLDQANYTYRVGTIVHASSELNIYHRFPTLFLTNDHTGCSELCSLYLHPDYRHSKAGALLSKSRFLFIAQHRHLFAEKLIAELRGFIDEQGGSPFWEGLGRHFFDMDFSQADYLSAVKDKQFIAELMPRYPFYTNFLPQSAQDVIGAVHKDTLPAKSLLEHEGFRYEGYVDIFDAGPTLECYMDRVRAIRDSYCASQLQVEALSGYPMLVSNRQLDQFRCALLWPEPSECHETDVAKLWGLLHLNEADKARCVSLERMVQE